MFWTICLVEMKQPINELSTQPSRSRRQAQIWWPESWRHFQLRMMIYSWVSSRRLLCDSQTYWQSQMVRMQTRCNVDVYQYLLWSCLWGYYTHGVEMALRSKARHWKNWTVQGYHATVWASVVGKRRNEPAQRLSQDQVPASKSGHRQHESLLCQTVADIHPCEGSVRFGSEIVRS